MADPLSIAASIAGLITLAEGVFNTTLSYCKGVKHAPKEITAFSTQISLLSGTLYRLSLLTRRLDSNAAGLDIKHEHIYECQKLLERIKKKLSKQSHDSEGSIGHNMKQIVRRLDWPLSKPEITEIMTQISQMTSTFDLALSVENMNTVLSLSEDIGTIKTELKRRQEVEVRIELDMARQMVINFFEPISPRQNHEMSLKLRYEGTGLWLTKGDDLQSWLKSPDGHLWLHGIPGAGKTILASAVIQSAIETMKPKESLSYFYCDYKDTKRQDPVIIFGSIAGKCPNRIER
jgi:hypothetical protein